MTMLDLKPTEAAFARAGKIRLGIKVKNKNGVEYPKEVEYFVLNDVPELADFFQVVYQTDKPKELPIFFMFDDIEANLTGWHKLHLASSVYCKGDGQRVVYAVDQNTGQRVVDKGHVIRDTKFDDTDFRPGDVISCPGYNKADGWKRCQFCAPHTTLKFMIRGLPVETLQMAVYHIETVSVNNYAMLYQQMMGIKELARRLTGQAYLTGIPVILQRKKESIGAPNLDKNGNRKKDGNGKQMPSRMRTDHYLLSLTVEPEWVQSVMARQMKLAGGSLNDAPVTIPASIDDDPIEGEFMADIEGDYINEDYDHFINSKVLSNIKYFDTKDQIDEAMTKLDLTYDPENEDHIFDSLARYADNKANEEANKEKYLL